MTVTVVEAAGHVLPGEDPAASQVVAAALMADGAALHVGQEVASAARDGAVHRLSLAGGDVVESDVVLVATGKAAVTDGLGLDRLGIETDRAGHIVVSDTCATNVPGVWAIGDVTSRGGFTHVAGHMGFVAGRNVTRSNRFVPPSKVDQRVVPRVVFTSPEVAQVGMTESEAAEVGGRVAELPLHRIDRAVTSGATEGFVKLMAGPRPVLRSIGGGQILGATIVAPRAGELIGEAALAMKTRMFTGRLAQTIHAYPTWSMGVQSAASLFFFPSDGLDARPARR